MLSRRRSSKFAWLVAYALLVPATLWGQSKLALEFPEVDGWAKGTRYDQRDGSTSISYTTKAKVGSDYIRVQVKSLVAASVADALPAAEKKILENPIHKNMTKQSSRETKTGKGTIVTHVVFTSELTGRPHETSLDVFSCGKHVVCLDEYCLATDAKEHATEVRKLVQALVEAAEKAN